MVLFGFVVPYFAGWEIDPTGKAVMVGSFFIAWALVHPICLKWYTPYGYGLDPSQVL